jgi:hypothetical protein
MLQVRTTTTPFALALVLAVLYKYLSKSRKDNLLPPGPPAIQSSQVWALDYPHIQFVNAKLTIILV